MMMTEADPKFTTYWRRSGEPKTCKFCHAHIWWNVVEHKWYNPGGEVQHIDTCPLWKTDYLQRKQEFRKISNSQEKNQCETRRYCVS